MDNRQCAYEGPLPEAEGLTCSPRPGVGGSEVSFREPLPVVLWKVSWNSCPAALPHCSTA